jgi:hypothetical protein
MVVRRYAVSAAAVTSHVRALQADSVRALTPGGSPPGADHALCPHCRSRSRTLSGIIGDTIVRMAMTLRLADDETDALRRRAELEQRSMQEVARQAIREYVENHSRAELLDQVLDEELPRYAEALERLGQ